MPKKASTGTPVLSVKPAPAVAASAPQPVLRGKCTGCVNKWPFASGVCPVCENEVVPI